ncbi:MAG: LptA/OstA family protein, partial [Candidatus Omnitrophota bacterium]
MFNRKITRVTAILVSILIICGVSSVCLANDILKPKKGQPIVVDGDDVEYFEKENKIVAKGNVFVTHGDVKLTCDRIVVDTKTREVLCEGNVRIENPKGVMTGDRIRYDLLRKRGEIISGEIEAFPWFGSAEESKRVGMNEYVLQEGHITTCDLNTPHYRIKAKQIKVFPNDKVIAKNVTFYIDEVPTLWLPYYYHPILQSRAKVQFLFGQDGEWGNFLLSSWRFYIHGE